MDNNRFFEGMNVRDALAVNAVVGEVFERHHLNCVGCEGWCPDCTVKFVCDVFEVDVDELLMELEDAVSKPASGADK